jgi:hypothetical protein
MLRSYVAPNSIYQPEDPRKSSMSEAEIHYDDSIRSIEENEESIAALRKRSKILHKRIINMSKRHSITNNKRNDS